MDLRCRENHLSGFVAVSPPNRCRENYVSSPSRFHCSSVSGFRRHLNRQPFLYHEDPRKLSERLRNNFLCNINSFLEICFHKYSGRVITKAAILDPVIFVVPKLMSSGGIICGIIFRYVCYNLSTRSRSRPTYTLGAMPGTI